MSSADKIIIAGTGRCGTTFLIQLLTAAGADTGLVHSDDMWYFTQYQKIVEMTENGEVLRVERNDVPGEYRAYTPEIHAGCEYHMALTDTAEAIAGLPKVIKNPRLATCAGKLMDAGLLRIEHMIIPVRSLSEVSNSKRQLFKHADQPFYNEVRKSLYDESAMQLGTLVADMTVRGVPMTFLHFPRIVHDPDYLFEKLAGPCQLTRPQFDDAFAVSARPEFVTKVVGTPLYEFTHDWTKALLPSVKFLAQNRGKRNVDYLEIGVFEGRGAVAVLTHINVEGGTYTGIDNWGMDKPGTSVYRERAIANIQKAIGSRPIPARFMHSDTLPALKQLAKEGRTFDMIYVDDDHTYEHVLKVSRAAWKLLRPGGFMLWDDLKHKKGAHEEFGDPGRAVLTFLPEVGLDRSRAVIFDNQAVIKRPANS